MLKRPAMQTWKRIEARWWPVERVKLGCFFCARGTAPGHLHIPSGKERAAA